MAMNFVNMMMMMMIVADDTMLHNIELERTTSNSMDNCFRLNSTQDNSHLFTVVDIVFQTTLSIQRWEQIASNLYLI